MTTQELHIQIDQLLQKVSSHWNSNFLPQEKDAFINREILKFIKQRLNPLSNTKRQSIYDILKRIKDLNALVKTVPLDIVNINPKEAGYQLPFDFLYYVSSEIDATPTCHVEDKLIVDKPVYYRSIDKVKIINSLLTLSISTTIGSNTTEVFNLNMLPAGYLPVDSIADYKKTFIINNVILSTLRRNLPLGIEVEYNTISNRFVFRSYTPFVLNYTLNTIAQVVIAETKVLKGYKEAESLVAEVRIVDEEFKTPINRSFLSSSKDESFVGYLRHDMVILPKVSNVVLSSASLTYICKPAKVDVLLDYNSDFSSEVLDEVIANLVQQLKGVISSDTYEKYSQENLLIE